MPPPLLLDLLPLGLTVQPGDTIVLVCLDGVLVQNADVAGFVGVDPKVEGLIEIGATLRGKVYLCDKT